MSDLMTPTQPVTAPPVDRRDHRIGWMDPMAQRVWDHVSHSPLESLWDFHGVSPWVVMKRTFSAFLDDNLLSRAAELGYYFLFALFPTLVSASAILGLAAKKASDIYLHLLHYLALLVPASAYQIVIETFNQTTASATGGKVTLGLAAAIWSASVGFSAMQDGMNTVYKVRETRPYWKARGSAMLVTGLLSLIVTLNLAALLGGDLLAKYAGAHIWHRFLAVSAEVAIRGLSWIAAVSLLVLLFSTIYYFAPDLKCKCWHWLTPGAAIGILGWVLASLGLRVYLHYFDNFSLTYGSLGAVIVLLTWFYITGLMLLFGAEINSEIQAAVVEKKLKAEGTLPVEAEVRG
jgi:membrane protein